jgi:capsular polysaccharide export protein
MNYFFGFSSWKHRFVEPFFEQKPIFINPLFGQGHLKKALSKGLDSKKFIYIWGRKSFSEVERYAHTYRLPIFRVEDGFIRSVSLGSDLTQPYSLVVDSRGIYFDPTIQSDLEVILETTEFDEELLVRARKIKDYVIEKKLSKYNLYDDTVLNFPSNKKIVVVPGQVEDDASIAYGAAGMTNLKLLQHVRSNRPNAYIVYKPHPDVLSGNRVGQVDLDEALMYCDRIVTEVSIDSVLSCADEVHTMTSLVGFEALMRGIKVSTYGIPFYAGWGLSEDAHSCERRMRILTVDELVAGALLLYPRYIHPQTLQKCEIEELLEALEVQRTNYKNSLWMKVQNEVSRKSQMLIRGFKGLHEQTVGKEKK